MIIGFFDPTGKGRLTSQMSLITSLLALNNGKRNLLITTKPEKVLHYYGVSEASDSRLKKMEDLNRLILYGRLTPQLLRDHTFPVIKGAELDYLDSRGLRQKALEMDMGQQKDAGYWETFFGYMVDSAVGIYDYVFFDLQDDLALLPLVNLLIIVLPQNYYEVSRVKPIIERATGLVEKSPLLFFGSYLSDTKWTKNRLTKKMTHFDKMVWPFSYDCFNAFNEGKVIDFIRRQGEDYKVQTQGLTNFVEQGRQKERVAK